MDAMKILGSLLGGGAMTSRQGNDALGGLLKGALGGGAGGGLADVLGGATGGGAAGGVGDLLGAALGGRASGGGGGGLGGLLGAALGGGSRGTTGRGIGGMLGGVAMAAILKYAAGRMSGQGSGASSPRAAVSGGGSGLDLKAFETADANDQAELLVEAMIMAAKADGRVDEREEEAILGHLGELDSEEREFVRNRLRAAPDTARFAARVPPDQAEQVYAASVLAIELDERSEALHLRDLAQGLGLDAARCNAIHRELGAPEIFR